MSLSDMLLEGGVNFIFLLRRSGVFALPGDTFDAEVGENDEPEGVPEVGLLALAEGEGISRKLFSHLPILSARVCTVCSGIPPNAYALEVSNRAFLWKYQ